MVWLLRYDGVGVVFVVVEVLIVCVLFGGVFGGFGVVEIDCEYGFVFFDVR